MGAKLSDSGQNWQQYEQASSGGRTKPRKRVTVAQSESALTKLAQIDADIRRGDLAARPDVSVRVFEPPDDDAA